MQRTHARARWTCIAAALLAVGSGAAAPPPAGGDDLYRFDVQFGAQGLSIDEARTARAQLYRDLPDAFFASAFGLQWRGFAGGWALDAAGSNMLRLDQRYRANLARPGLLALRGGWTEVPHFFSNASTALLAGGPGNYTLSSTLRQELETAATDPTAPVPIDMLMPDVLASSARRFDVRTHRRRADGEAAVQLGRGALLVLTAAHEKRQGERTISIGTYIRRQAVAGEPNTGPGNFDRERFEAIGLEIPEPIDHRIQEYGATASLHRKRGHVAVGWHGSFFRNRTGELLWDNPFEAPPSVASSSDRGRFAQGGLDLAPENDFHRLHAAGGVVLPRRTRIDAAFAYGIMLQDDAFMAFTRNEALFFPGPDGTLGTADDIPGTSPALLPAASLDGDIRTTRVTARAVSRPLPKLSVRVSLRDYKYDDKTPRLDLPGYAGFGESFFRRGVGQKEGAADVLFNEVGGYDQRVLGGGFGYQLVPRAGIDVEYTNTRWEYDARQVESTTEDTWRGTLRFVPAPGMTARLGFVGGQRDFEGTYAIGLETSRVRAFDVWNRDRTRYEAAIDYELDERWSFGVAFYDATDEFPGAVPAPEPLPATGNTFPSFPYGLDESNTISASAQAAYHDARWNLTAGYGRDTSDWAGLSVTKTTLANDNVQYDPKNRWERNQEDTMDWASLGVTYVVAPQRLQLMADFAWSHYDGELMTTNPETPDVNSAVAYAFPGLESDTFTAKLGLQWTMRPGLDLSARYWYEPYRLDDWQWDNVQPYMQGVIQETAGTPTTFRDATVSRYLFLDNRYSDYTLHAFAVALSTYF